MSGPHRISVVIPVFGERDSLEQLVAELIPVMEGLATPYEVVFVDDGSRDGSDVVLVDLAMRYEPIRVVKLRSNFGKGAALTAGFREARGSPWPRSPGWWGSSSSCRPLDRRRAQPTPTGLRGWWARRPARVPVRARGWP
ncbi:MAG: glycosyltransferase [Thermoleophilia bacterium]|nr:glycosyltransferase [Thermoleophilia bacterium]